MRASLFAALLCGACASAPAPSPGPRVSGPAIFVAPGEAAVGQDVAAYVRLYNPGLVTARLVEGSCTCAQRLELHSTFDSSMHALAHLDVPAGGTLEIKPGGVFHLMLMGLKLAIHPGDHVKVTLVFEDGAKLAADFVGVANSSEGWAEEAAKLSAG